MPVMELAKGHTVCILMVRLDTEITNQWNGGRMMGDDICMEIPIPTDEDGYVLFRCPQCGTFFKAAPSDVEDDGVLEIYCPSCGLSSDNYLTDDVIELALATFKNKAMDMIHDEFKKMERQLTKDFGIFKAGKKPEKEPENPIRSGIQSLVIASFSCCTRTAKIKPMFKMTGCYCPFCGVKNYEVE